MYSSEHREKFSGFSLWKKCPFLLEITGEEWGFSWCFQRNCNLFLFNLGIVLKSFIKNSHIKHVSSVLLFCFELDLFFKKRKPILFSLIWIWITREQQEWLNSATPVEWAFLFITHVEISESTPHPPKKVHFQLHIYIFI